MSFGSNTNAAGSAGAGGSADAAPSVLVIFPATVYQEQHTIY